MRATRLLAVLVGFAVVATSTVTPANSAQDETRWTQEQNFLGYRARLEIIDGRDSPVVMVKVRNPMDYSQQLQVRGLLGQTDPKLCINTRRTCNEFSAGVSNQEPILLPRSETLIQILAGPADAAGLVELFVEPTVQSAAFDFAFVTAQILLSMAGCDSTQDREFVARVALLLTPEFVEIANRSDTLGLVALADLTALVPRVLQILKAELLMGFFTAPVGCALADLGSSEGVLANSLFLVSWGLRLFPLAKLTGIYAELGFFADEIATALRLSYEPPSDTTLQAKDTRIPATVTWVEDGDTICVQLDTPPPSGALSDRCDESDAPPGIEDWPVRLIGIDAPEIPPTRDDCFGREATDQLRTLVEGKQVMLEFDPDQQVDGTEYRRILAYVWLNGELVNDQMVRQGYAREAHWYPDTGTVAPAKYRDQLVAAETQARTARRGLWAACDTTPEPPVANLDDSQGTTTNTVAGNVSPIARIRLAFTEYLAGEGETLVVDGAADEPSNVAFESSSEDPDGTIVLVEWLIDDAVISTNLDCGGNTLQIYCSYPVSLIADGLHTVTLRVTDDDGAIDSASATIDRQVVYYGFFPSGRLLCGWDGDYQPVSGSEGGVSVIRTFASDPGQPAQVSILHEDPTGDSSGYYTWQSSVVATDDAGNVLWSDAFETNGYNPPDSPPVSMLLFEDVTGDQNRDLIVCVSTPQGNWSAVEIVIVVETANGWVPVLREGRDDGWISLLSDGILELGGRTTTAACSYVTIDTYRWNQTRFNFESQRQGTIRYDSEVQC